MLLRLRGSGQVFRGGLDRAVEKELLKTADVAEAQVVVVVGLMRRWIELLKKSC